MDNADECPDYYRDLSAERALDSTRALIDYVRGHPDNHEGRVLPVVTPRFILILYRRDARGPRCHRQECGCRVQTHCSESDWAHGYVLARRWHGRIRTSFDRFGLLNQHNKDGSGACEFQLTAKDMEAVTCALKPAVAHCPLFRTPISPMPSFHCVPHWTRGCMLVSARTFPVAERFYDRERPWRNPGVADAAEWCRPEPAAISPLDVRPGQIDFRDAFYIATTGGGIALDLPVGQFTPGYQFDAVLIDADAEKGTVRLFEDRDKGESDILQKIIYTASKGKHRGHLGRRPQV